MTEDEIREAEDRENAEHAKKWEGVKYHLEDKPVISTDPRTGNLPSGYWRSTKARTHGRMPRRRR